MLQSTTAADLGMLRADRHGVNAMFDDDYCKL